MDSLEADLLLAQREAHDEGYRAICKDLGDALEFARQALRRDVLNEPMEPMRLGGLDPAGSGQEPYPAKNTTISPISCRITPRAEPCSPSTGPAPPPGRRSWPATRRSGDLNGLCTREDLLQGFNRLSSFLWILEIRLASGQEKKG